MTTEDLKEGLTDIELANQLLLVLSNGPMLKIEVFRRMKFDWRRIAAAANKCGIIRSQWRHQGNKYEVWSLTRVYDQDTPEACAMFFCDECSEWTIKARQTMMKLQTPCRICGLPAGFKARKSNDHPHEMAQAEGSDPSDPIFDWRHATRPSEAEPALARSSEQGGRLSEAGHKPRGGKKPGS